jgi:hypothetical protein
VLRLMLVSVQKPCRRGRTLFQLLLTFLEESLRHEFCFVFVRGMIYQS